VLKNATSVAVIAMAPMVIVCLLIGCVVLVR
jgi:hypothetical protein